MRILTLVALILGFETMAADWPQFLGPERNGVYRGPALAETWGEGVPPVVWRQQVGQGLSGPVVVDGRIILFHRVSDREVVEAFDRKTGKSLWQYGYPTTYRDDFGFDEGPRSVPVVVDGVVYTFGAQAQLHAVELETGEPVWSVDTMRRFRVPKGYFGAAGSPLVEDGRVIANIGGRDAGIIAFDAKDGEVLWTSTRDGASYSSPVSATIAERPYLIFFTRNGLVGARSGNREGGIRKALAVAIGIIHQRGVADRHRRFNIHLGGIRPWGRSVAVGRGTFDRTLVVERRPVEPLRHQRLPGRLSLRIPRSTGVRPEPAGCRVPNR